MRRRTKSSPQPLNILVYGPPSSGKSSFIQSVSHFLTTSTLLSGDLPITTATLADHQLCLNLIDTPSHWTLDQVLQEIQGRMEVSVVEETKLKRSKSTLANHIHCVIYLMGCREDAISIFQRTCVLPIITHGDTLTLKQSIQLKEDMHDWIMEITNPMVLEGNAPFVVINGEEGTRFREYPWGMIDAVNRDHSDTANLIESLVHNADTLLKKQLENYEEYRSELLSNLMKESEKEFVKESNETSEPSLSPLLAYRLTRMLFE